MFITCAGIGISALCLLAWFWPKKMTFGFLSQLVFPAKRAHQAPRAAARHLVSLP